MRKQAGENRLEKGTLLFILFQLKKDEGPDKCFVGHITFEPEGNVHSLHAEGTQNRVWTSTPPGPQPEADLGRQGDNPVEEHLGGDKETLLLKHSLFLLTQKNLELWKTHMN